MQAFFGANVPAHKVHNIRFEGPPSTALGVHISHP